MDFTEDFFLCDSCQRKDFKLIYNFSIRFHGVNFSDELIYDKLTEARYQCAHCSKTFSIEEIEKCLAEFKRKRKP